MRRFVTLLTDFGDQDGFVGTMKGRIWSINPGLDIVDISHNISPQNIWQAAYSLQRYCKHWPEDTIHVAVVDPGVGSQRMALALKCDKHWLIGPNNGLLSLAALKYNKVTAYAIKPNSAVAKKHQSFDGLSVFAPVAAALASGTAIEELATPIESIHQIEYPEPDLVNGQLIGQIIGFDRFGNAQTNISQGDLSGQPNLKVYCAEGSYPLCRCYSDAAIDGKFAIINSDNQLELGLYQSSAEFELELNVGALVYVPLQS